MAYRKKVKKRARAGFGQPEEKTERTALLYTRVANHAASDHGAAHAEQERQCREHACMQGYAVAAVFRDDISGNAPERPGMAAMLACLKENDGGRCRVVVADVTRLSRDIGLVMELTMAIIRAGGSLDIVAQSGRTLTKAQFDSFFTWAMGKYRERRSARVKH